MRCVNIVGCSRDICCKQHAHNSYIGCINTNSSASRGQNSTAGGQPDGPPTRWPGGAAIIRPHPTTLIVTTADPQRPTTERTNRSTSFTPNHASSQSCVNNHSQKPQPPHRRILSHSQNCTNEPSGTHTGLNRPAIGTNGANSGTDRPTGGTERAINGAHRQTT